MECEFEEAASKAVSLATGRVATLRAQCLDRSLKVMLHIAKTMDIRTLTDNNMSMLEAFMVEQSGLAATAGVCNQTDAAFEVSLISQPRLSRSPGATPSVAAVVSCPVELGRLFKTERVIAMGIEPVD